MPLANYICFGTKQLLANCFSTYQCHRTYLQYAPAGCPLPCTRRQVPCGAHPCSSQSWTRDSCDESVLRFVPEQVIMADQQMLPWKFLMQILKNLYLCKKLLDALIRCLRPHLDCYLSTIRQGATVDFPKPSLAEHTLELVCYDLYFAVRE